MSLVEFRDMEDEIIYQTDNHLFSLMPYNPGKKMYFHGREYEVIDSFLKNTKTSYWWSFGIKFDSFKLVIYIEPV